MSVERSKRAVDSASVVEAKRAASLAVLRVDRGAQRLPGGAGGDGGVAARGRGASAWRWEARVEQPAARANCRIFQQKSVPRS